MTTMRGSVFTRVRTLSPLTAVAVALAGLLGALPPAAVAAVTSPALDAVQSAADFPRIRQTVEFLRMDWESGEAVPETRPLADSAPFLPARALRAALPDAAPIRAEVPAYRVERGLRNVVNRAAFGAFTPDQEEKLERLGFVSTRADLPQMFYVYEQNVYANLPSFVTTDVLLHTLGDLFAYALKTVERRSLFGWTLHLARALRAESVRQAEKASVPALKEAALENAAYFAVAERLLSGREVALPAPAAAIVRAELDRIRRAGGLEISFTGHEVDYAEFRPRGHYTLSEDAQNYFRAVQWLGQVPFDIPREGALRPGAISPEVLRAQLVLLALRDARGVGRARLVRAQAMRARLDELTALFTAEPSTLAPPDWTRALDAVYGARVRPQALLDPAAQRRFIAAVRALPEPPMRRITAEALSPWQMRFLPRRAVLDARIMQALVGLDRPHSRAIEVLSALGIPRAHELVVAAGTDDLPAWYPGRLEGLRTAVAAMTPERWASGIYPGFLWLMAGTTPPEGEGMPWFTRSDAWRDRALTAACGGWAELRHHTILYAESYGAEGGGDAYQVDLPKGYVEPNPVFFRRARWLAQKLRADLARHGCLTARMDEKMRLYAGIADRAASIAERELAWLPLREDDYRFIHFLGSDLARITTDCLLNDAEDARAVWDALPEARRSMAVVADVGTARGQALTIGTGTARELYVVVPSRQGPRLARGAVYEYFEFLQPADDRLTDEAWQARLASPNRPAPAAWQASYASPHAKPAPTGLADASAEAYFEYTFTPD